MDSSFNIKYLMGVTEARVSTAHRGANIMYYDMKMKFYSLRSHSKRMILNAVSNVIHIA